MRDITGRELVRSASVLEKTTLFADHSLHLALGNTVTVTPSFSCVYTHTDSSFK